MVGDCSRNSIVVLLCLSGSWTAQADGQAGDQLQLTAAGQQTLDTLTTALHDSLAELLDGWSPEQEAELAALLRRVATDLFSQENSKELISASGGPQLI